MTERRTLTPARMSGVFKRKAKKKEGREGEVGGDKEVLIHNQTVVPVR